MDNVGIVVENLDVSISFFTDLGQKLQMRAIIEGEWAGRVTGLGNQEVETAMMITPDGHSQLELSRFSQSACDLGSQNGPGKCAWLSTGNVHCERHDDTLNRLSANGAKLVGEVVRYEESYRLCYIRGPEGLLIGLAEELKNK